MFMYMYMYVHEVDVTRKTDVNSVFLAPYSPLHSVFPPVDLFPFLVQGHHMKLFMTYAVQHTLGSQILIKIASQEKFRSWLEKTEVSFTDLFHCLLAGSICWVAAVLCGWGGINCVGFTATTLYQL